MKNLAIIAISLFSTGAFAGTNSSEMVTTLKIKAWGNSHPSWTVTGNKSCIKQIKYIPSEETRWTNIGTPNEPPRYKFEVTHKPGCNAIITFNWDGSPNDSDMRPDSFARVEMNQYR